MSLGASGWIKLNVGGQPFLTTLTTILSCPESTLSKMFDPDSGFEPAYQENGVYFLDADPKYFGIILNWMRHRKIMADSEINLDNVAEIELIADYFGLLDLVEEIKQSRKPPSPIFGQWMKLEDIPSQNKVAAMTMIITPLDHSGLAATIVQRSEKLILDIYDDFIYDPEREDANHLSLEPEGRRAVWVKTKTGRIPPEAIAVEGKEGKRMFIGRKLWLEDGTSLQVFDYEDGEIILPIDANISVGYVNEKGIWSISFSDSVKNMVEFTLGNRDMQDLQDDNKWKECSSSEFEILCIF